ncbi:SMC-Scp complex subunit ScpB [Trichothermofontia sp.]
MSSLSAKVEAILYLKGQALTIAQIAAYARCDREAVEEALLELMDDYNHRDSALEVIETAEGYSLQLRSAFQGLVEQLIPLDLGVGALRTLAAIALKGSILQTELIELRGSGAYQHVQELIEKGFVRKRRVADSRSSRLLLTDKFFRYFQTESLPQISALGPGAEATTALPDDPESSPISAPETHTAVDRPLPSL